MNEAIRFSTYTHADLDDALFERIEALPKRVWPDIPGGGDASERSRARRNSSWHVAWLGETPVACARTFSRLIRRPDGEREVLALASVCVDPDHRGTGLGAQIVRLAFSAVDNGRFEMSLFQTGVPEFYRKLGARTVDNRFWNSASGDASENPWWDPNVMIYPASVDWPKGPVDLKGPAY